MRSCDVNQMGRSRVVVGMGVEGRGVKQVDDFKQSEDQATYTWHSTVCGKYIGTLCFGCEYVHEF